jgi:hypothetical protein
VRQHVAIRREEYVAGTRERPEVGIFTQTHVTRPPFPWGRIAVGETVWMKWAGGPIVARARVSGFRQLTACTPDTLRQATHGFRLHDLADYWQTRPPLCFAMAIYLEDERWLDHALVPSGRSYGESWIVLPDDAMASAWFAEAPGELPAADSTSARARRPSRTISSSLRFEVLRRDGFTCTYCGRRAPDVVLHVDHIQPWIAGGPTHLDNLRAACGDCNLGKGARSL